MTDEQIIEMLFSRLENGISEIDRKYGRKCRSIALEILGSKEDAEECVNDAYLGVWNAIPPESPKPLSTFVYRILRNTALKKQRAAKTGKRGGVYTAALDEIAESFASSETVEKAMESREIKTHINGFLRSLDKENRVIFMRRYWFMESNKAIAAETGMSEGNVRVKLLRLREKLRKYLEERGVEV